MRISSIIAISLLSLAAMLSQCAKEDETKQGLSQRLLSDEAQLLSEIGRSGDRSQFPQKLSETELFAAYSPLEAKSSLIPYSINVPFWSDGAVKQRWIYVGEGRVDIQSDDSWQFPEGSLAIKHFNIRQDATNPDSLIFLETRILVNSGDDWVALSYRWLEDGSDAVLVDDAGETREIQMTNASGESETLAWNFPSVAECKTCHNAQSGDLLGLRTPQMNRTYNYNGFEQNQIQAWAQVGLFTEDSPTILSDLPQFPSFLELAAASSKDEIDTAARIYLDVNCASCHQADSPVGVDLDLSLNADLQTLINQPQDRGDLGVEGAVILKAGEPELSLIYMRMNRDDFYHMPYISSRQIDKTGTNLIKNWIILMDAQ